MARAIWVLVSLCLLSSSTFYAGQNTTRRPPVIDTHSHLTAEAAARIIDSLNVRYLFVTGDREGFPKLETMANRYLPALSFPCPGGRPALFGGPPCFETGTEFPDIAWVRGEVQAGRIKAFGEVLSQLLGVAPGDSRMEPYWSLAEEFDIPVAIHVGPGFL